MHGAHDASRDAHAIFARRHGIDEVLLVRGGAFIHVNSLRPGSAQVERDCRLVARGVGRFAACKGSAAEFVAPITMRHRLPFAHYAAPYAAVLACKSADDCSEFCEEAGLCSAA